MSVSDLIGSSQKFRAVLENVGTVAPADCAVLSKARPAQGRKDRTSHSRC